MEVATMENETDMVVKRLSVPMGLEELMESLTKEVLRQKPSDIYAFASQHFAQLLEIRDQGNTRGSLRKLRKSNSEVPKSSDVTNFSKNNPVKLKSASFGTMSKGTRNKTPAPKSFSTPKTVPAKVESNISPRTFYNNNYNNKNARQEKTKTFMDKRRAVKKKSVDEKKSIQLNKQPLELESKKVIQVQRKPDNARMGTDQRRRSIGQKRSEEKGVKDNFRSRSISTNREADANKTTRKSEEGKKTKFRSETKDISEIEKNNIAGKETSKRTDILNEDVQDGSILPSNMSDISDSVVTQMERQKSKRDDKDTLQGEELRIAISKATKQEGESISGIESEESKDSLLTEEQRSPRDEISVINENKDFRESPSENSDVTSDETDKISDGRIGIILSNISSSEPISDLVESKNGLNESIVQEKYKDIESENTQKSNSNNADKVSLGTADKDAVMQLDITISEATEPNVKIYESTSLELDAEVKENLDEKKDDQNIHSTDDIVDVTKDAVSNVSLNAESIALTENKIAKDIDDSILESNVRNIDAVSTTDELTESESREVQEEIKCISGRIISEDTKQSIEENEEEINAAVKIQALTRGYLTRKSVNQRKLTPFENVEETSKLDDSVLKSINEVEEKLTDADKNESQNERENNEIKIVKEQLEFPYTNTDQQTLAGEDKIIVHKQNTGETEIIDDKVNSSVSSDISERQMDKFVAAAKIQALTRGYLTRKAINKNKTNIHPNNESLKENLITKESHTKEETDILMDTTRAAIVIQALVKGYLVRKNIKKSTELSNELSKEIPVNMNIISEDERTFDESQGSVHENENYKKITSDFLDLEHTHYESSRYDDSINQDKVKPEAAEPIIHSITEEEKEMPNADLGRESTLFVTKEPFGADVGPKPTSIERLADVSNYMNNDVAINSFERNDLQKPPECDELPHQRNSAENAMKAATVIQALFRGYIIRKRYENTEKRLAKRKTFEEKLPTVLEVDDEDNKDAIMLSKNVIEKLSTDVVEELEEQQQQRSDNPNFSSLQANKTLSDEEVFAILKQLDDTPIPREEPRRRSKTYSRSLTIDEPSIHHIHPLSKSMTFIIGDEFQSFDTIDSVDQSLKNTETEDSISIGSSASNITEITTAIKEDVQKLKRTLENGLGMERTEDTESFTNDGNITEITKGISDDVKQLEKTLSQDVDNIVTSKNLDSSAKNDNSVEDNNEFLIRPLSKDSVTSTDSVNTVIFIDSSKKGLVSENELSSNTAVKDTDIGNTSDAEDQVISNIVDINEVNTEKIKEQGDIIVNDILDTAAKKIQKFFREIKNKSDSENGDKLKGNSEEISSDLAHGLTTEKRQSTTSDELRQLWQDDAATIIQKNYKGYRVRRDLEKQKETLEDKKNKEEMVEKVITRYLNKITEPVRRAFSADKHVEEEKPHEAKKRAHSADISKPDIVYIPLRDYSDEENETLERITEIASSEVTQNLQDKEVNMTKDESEINQHVPKVAEEEICIKQNVQEINSLTTDLDSNINDRMDKKNPQQELHNEDADISDKIITDKEAEEKISTYITAMVEPIKKTFQLQESAGEEIIVEEPHPVYQYIPLRSYSEDETAEVVTSLDDNIVTSMSTLEEDIDNNENNGKLGDNEIEPHKIEEIVDEGEKSTFEKVEATTTTDLDATLESNPIDLGVESNDKANTAVLLRAVDETSVDNQESDQTNIKENLVQSDASAAEGYGSKEIEEYINSLIEPVKQKFSPYRMESVATNQIDIAPKEEEPVYTYIPLKDHSIEGHEQENGERDTQNANDKFGTSESTHFLEEFNQTDHELKTDDPLVNEIGVDQELGRIEEVTKIDSNAGNDLEEIHLQDGKLDSSLKEQVLDIDNKVQEVTESLQNDECDKLGLTAVAHEVDSNKLTNDTFTKIDFIDGLEKFKQTHDAKQVTSDILATNNVEEIHDKDEVKDEINLVEKNEIVLSNIGSESESLEVTQLELFKTENVDLVKDDDSNIQNANEDLYLIVKSTNGNNVGESEIEAQKLVVDTAEDETSKDQTNLDIQVSELSLESTGITKQTSSTDKELICGSTVNNIEAVHDTELSIDSKKEEISQLNENLNQNNSELNGLDVDIISKTPDSKESKDAQDIKELNKEDLLKDDISKSVIAQGSSETDQDTSIVEDLKTDDNSLNGSTSDYSSHLDNIIKIEIKDKFSKESVLKSRPIEEMKNIDEENNNKVDAVSEGDDVNGKKEIDLDSLGTIPIETDSIKNSNEQIDKDKGVTDDLSTNIEKPLEDTLVNEVKTNAPESELLPLNDPNSKGIIQEDEIKREVTADVVGDESEVKDVAVNKNLKESSHLNEDNVLRNESISSLDEVNDAKFQKIENNELIISNLKDAGELSNNENMKLEISESEIDNEEIKKKETANDDKHADYEITDEEMQARLENIESQIENVLEKINSASLSKTEHNGQFNETGFPVNDENNKKIGQEALNEKDLGSFNIEETVSVGNNKENEADNESGKLLAGNQLVNDDTLYSGEKSVQSTDSNLQADNVTNITNTLEENTPEIDIENDNLPTVESLSTENNIHENEDGVLHESLSGNSLNKVDNSCDNIDESKVETQKLVGIENTVEEKTPKDQTNLDIPVSELLDSTDTRKEISSSTDKETVLDKLENHNKSNLISVDLDNKDQEVNEVINEHKNLEQNLDGNNVKNNIEKVKDGNDIADPIELQNIDVVDTKVDSHDNIDKSKIETQKPEETVNFVDESLKDQSVSDTSVNKLSPENIDTDEQVLSSNKEFSSDELEDRKVNKEADLQTVSSDIKDREAEEFANGNNVEKISEPILEENDGVDTKNKIETGIGKGDDVTEQLSLGSVGEKINSHDNSDELKNERQHVELDSNIENQDHVETVDTIKGEISKDQIISNVQVSEPSIEREINDEQMQDIKTQNVTDIQPILEESHTVDNITGSSEIVIVGDSDAAGHEQKLKLTETDGTMDSYDNVDESKIEAQKPVKDANITKHDVLDGETILSVTNHGLLQSDFNELGPHENFDKSGLQNVNLDIKDAVMEDIVNEKKINDDINAPTLEIDDTKNNIKTFVSGDGVDDTKQSSLNETDNKMNSDNNAEESKIETQKPVGPESTSEGEALKDQENLNERLLQTNEIDKEKLPSVATEPNSDSLESHNENAKADFLNLNIKDEDVKEAKKVDNENKIIRNTSAQNITNSQSNFEEIDKINDFKNDIETTVSGDVINAADKSAINKIDKNGHDKFDDTKTETQMQTGTQHTAKEDIIKDQINFDIPVSEPSLKNIDVEKQSNFEELESHKDIDRSDLKSSEEAVPENKIHDANSLSVTNIQPNFISNDKIDNVKNNNEGVMSEDDAVDDIEQPAVKEVPVNTDLEKDENLEVVINTDTGNENENKVYDDNNIQNNSKEQSETMSSADKIENTNENAVKETDGSDIKTEPCLKNSHDVESKALEDQLRQENQDSELHNSQHGGRGSDNAMESSSVQENLSENETNKNKMIIEAPNTDQHSNDENKNELRMDDQKSNLDTVQIPSGEIRENNVTVGKEIEPVCLNLGKSEKESVSEGEVNNNTVISKNIEEGLIEQIDTVQKHEEIDKVESEHSEKNSSNGQNKDETEIPGEIVVGKTTLNTVLESQRKENVNEGNEENKKKYGTILKEDQDRTSPFYLHQDLLFQDAPSINQERKFSEVLRLSADSDKQTETAEKLLHSSEYHDSIPVNIMTETNEKSLNTQSNGVQCNLGRERTMPTSTVLVHSGELHDNVLPLALQMNQDPGIEIVTSPSKFHKSTDGDAQASAKDVSERLGNTKTTRVQSELGNNTTSMDTERRNNSTIIKKNMESEAATKIQASFRGYQVRKTLKNKLARDNITSIKRTSRRKSLGRITDTPKSSAKQPTDLEEQSATKIQAGIRGFLVRRRQKKNKPNSESV